MILGAGRGPLVRSTINASVQAGRKVKLYVVEKNPNAIVSLIALQNEMWLHDGISHQNSEFSNEP